MDNNEQLIQEMKAVLDFSNMYDMRDVENVKQVLSFIEPNTMNATPIGKQYLARLNSILAGNNDGVCFICRKEPSHDGIICDACMSKFSGGKTTFYDQKINIDETFSEAILGNSSDNRQIIDNTDKQENEATSSVVDVASESAGVSKWNAFKTKGKELFDKAIKWEREQRVKLAISAAYAEEEDKRKPHVKKIRHERALTPTEKQTIELLKAKQNAAQAKAWKLGPGSAEQTEAYSLMRQIRELENDAVWYEEITEPPVIDPSIPIFVDEEAIRKRIMKE